MGLKEVYGVWAAWACGLAASEKSLQNHANQAGGQSEFRDKASTPSKPSIFKRDLKILYPLLS